MLDRPELIRWFGPSTSTTHRRAWNRVEALLLAPILKDMNASVDLPCEGCVLDVLLDRWNMNVEPLFQDASGRDEELTRKIQKTERSERANGLVPLGMRDTKAVSALKRSRPAIWESCVQAFDAWERHVLSLSAFMECVTDEFAAQVASRVPAITMRAVSDFHFELCVKDSDQLQIWWDETMNELNGQPELSERLMFFEGVFVRRISEALETLASTRHRYEVLASRDCERAGSSEATLLAQAVVEMGRLIAMIRNVSDRVVDSVRKIRPVRGPAWDAIAPEEALRALRDVLPCPVDSGDDADAVVCVRHRLDGLVVLVTDLSSFSLPADLVRFVAEMSEELLSVLDGLTSAFDWVRRWMDWEASPTVEHLEAIMAMPLCPDCELSVEQRKNRLLHMAQLKGLHVFLSDEAFRMEVVAPVARISNIEVLGTTMKSSSPVVRHLDVSAPPPAPVIETETSVSRQRRCKLMQKDVSVDIGSFPIRADEMLSVLPTALWDRDERAAGRFVAGVYTPMRANSKIKLPSLGRRSSSGALCGF